MLKIETNGQIITVKVDGKEVKNVEQILISIEKEILCQFLMGKTLESPRMWERIKFNEAEKK